MSWPSHCSALDHFSLGLYVPYRPSRLYLTWSWPDVGGCPAASSPVPDWTDIERTTHEEDVVDPDSGDLLTVPVHSLQRTGSSCHPIGFSTPLTLSHSQIVYKYTTLQSLLSSPLRPPLYNSQSWVFVYSHWNEGAGVFPLCSQKRPHTWVK